MVDVRGVLSQSDRPRERNRQWDIASSTTSGVYSGGAMDNYTTHLHNCMQMFRSSSCPDMQSLWEYVKAYRPIDISQKRGLTDQAFQPLQSNSSALEMLLQFSIFQIEPVPIAFAECDFYLIWTRWLLCLPTRRVPSAIQLPSPRQFKDIHGEDEHSKDCQPRWE